MSTTGPTPNRPPRIVIGSDDLDSSIPVASTGVRSTPSAAPPGPAPGGLPPVTPQPPPVQVNLAQQVGYASGPSNPMTKLGANSIVSGLVAGGVGGFIGFLLAENLYNPDSHFATTTLGRNTQAGVWGLIFAAGLGFVLMGWDGFTSGSVQKAFRDGSIGLAIGAASGFIGAFVAQFVYAKMLGVDALGVSHGKLIVARMVGWAVLGGLLGAGLGIKGGGKKLLNGLVGGLVGGALGGLLFQLITNANTTGSISGFVIRMLGLTLTGIGIGLGVGIVERVRRDSWIRIIGGPMAGKEFIIYNAQTRVGRDYRNDVVLAKDGSALPFHAMFVRDPTGRVSVVANTGAPLLVNGVQSAAAQLRGGDRVTIAASTFAYEERAVTQVSPGPGQYPPMR